MSFLGSVGQLYMFVLLVLLFLGSGFAVWKFIDFFIQKGFVKSDAVVKPKSLEQGQKQSSIERSNKKIGGIIMNNNGWLKLAVFSFVGILASVVILGLISSTNPQGASIHQQHQQQGMAQNGMGNMNMQSGMNVNSQMGNMQMNTTMGQNDMMMQQLMQLKMQLNQIQQQMGMMNGSMGGNMQMQSMPQSGMNNMGGMGMMGNMGGMGMMNMGNMYTTKNAQK